MASDYDVPNPHPRPAREGGFMDLLTPEGPETVFVLYKDIHFGFTRRAVIRKKTAALIDAPWIKSPSIRGNKVHVRTPMGVMRTKWKTIKEAIEALSMVLLHRTNHSTFGNLNLIGHSELKSNLKRYRLGYKIKTAQGETWEWVMISKQMRKKILDS